MQDRLIQPAGLQGLTPEFDPEFGTHSYGYRPGRSAHDAVRAAPEFIRAGQSWTVEVDLSACFDQASWYSCQEPSTRYDRSNRYWGD